MNSTTMHVIAALVVFASGVVASSKAQAQKLGSDRWSKEFLTLEEMKHAKVAMPDDQGARWKIKLEKTSRKQSVFGRTSNFFIRGTVATPFENCLILRSSDDGSPNGIGPIRLNRPSLQTIRTSHGVACILQPDGDAGAIYYTVLAAGDHEWHKLSGHTIAPWRLMSNQAGTRLMSCSDDGTIRLWDLDAFDKVGVRGQIGNEIAKFPSYKPAANAPIIRRECLDFAPNFRLATEFEGTITVRNSSDGAERFKWTPELPEGRTITAIAFAVDNKSLFAFLSVAEENKNDTLQFLQFITKSKTERQFRGARPVVYGLIVDNETVIAANDSGELGFWDIGSRKETAVLAVAPNRLYDMTVSPVGDILATAGDDGEAKLWDLTTRQRKATAKPFRHDGIDYIRFNAKGTHLVTASDDGWLKFWDAPEFTHDRRELPIESHTDVNRGLTREIYRDGHVEYKWFPKDED